MNRKTRLLIALLVLASMLVPGLAGATIAGPDAEKITLTAVGQRSALTKSFQELLFIEEIEKKFNIVLECTDYSEEEWKVQKGLLFASGDLPDVFLSGGFTLNEVADYGAQGFLLPLNDLIADIGVNTQSVFARNSAAEQLMTSPDGNIYTLVAGSAIPANMANRNWINEKWIERVGMAYPETLDDLYALLTAFKTQDANGNGDAEDEIPTSGRVLDEIVLNALGIPTNSRNGFQIFLKDGVPAMLALDPLYKVYLTYMRDCYADGLLDSATFVQTGDELNAKIAEGRVGAYSSPAPWLYESPETAWDYRYFGALTSAENNTPMIGASSGLVASGAVAISTSNPYPERTFEMLDWFYSDDGSTFAFIGEEGVGWEWVDESTGEWKRVIPADWTDSDEAYRNGVLTIGGLNMYRDTSWKLFEPTGNNVWLYDQYTDYAVPYFTDIFPTVILTEDEQERASLLQVDLSNYLTDATTRFIVGEEDIDAGWDSFQATLLRMGAEDYVAVYTDAYHRLTGN